MIVIEKNTANTIVLTLSEKTTLENAVYLFEFTNDLSKEVKTFIVSDTSSNKVRYNKFSIIENTTEDLLNGIISLSLTGFWKYRVFEQTSTTNLNVDLATNLVEIGKVKVIATSTNDVEYNNGETSYIVYGG